MPERSAQLPCVTWPVFHIVHSAHLNRSKLYKKNIVKTKKKINIFLIESTATNYCTRFVLLRVAFRSNLPGSSNVRRLRVTQKSGENEKKNEGPRPVVLSGQGDVDDEDEEDDVQSERGRGMKRERTRSW